MKSGIFIAAHMPVSARGARADEGFQLRVIKNKKRCSRNKGAIKEVVEDAAAEVHKEVRRPAQEFSDQT
jgi:hypothetical protein